MLFCSVVSHNLFALQRLIHRRVIYSRLSANSSKHFCCDDLSCYQATINGETSINNNFFARHRDSFQGEGIARICWFSSGPWDLIVMTFPGSIGTRTACEAIKTSLSTRFAFKARKIKISAKKILTQAVSNLGEWRKIAKRQSMWQSRSNHPSYDINRNQLSNRTGLNSIWAFDRKES